MTRFFLKSCVFILIAFQLLQSVDTYFFQDNLVRDSINLVKSSNDGLDIVFFGNSHSYNTFNPAIIENELRLSAANVGSSAQKLAATSVIADMVLKSKTPKLAIVTLFKLSFDETPIDEIDPSNYVAIDFLPHSVLKTKFITDSFRPEDWPAAFSETIRNHSKWPKAKRPSTKVKRLKGLDFYKGYFNYNNRISEKTFTEFKKKYEAEDVIYNTLPPLAKKRIDDLLEIFDERGVPVLFVVAPSYIYDYSVSHNSYITAIKNYLTEKKRVYLDLNMVKDDIGLEKKHYQNPNHLNSHGAILTTQYLVQYLKNNWNHEMQNESLDLKKNRFYQLESMSTGLFSTILDSITIKKLYGIKSVKLFQPGEDRFEILCKLSSDTIGQQPFRLEHDVTEEELRQFRDQKIFQNTEKTKIVYYGQFSQKDAIKYNGQPFVFFSFKSPLDSFRNLSFHAGDRRTTTVFRIDSLSVAE